MEFCGQSGESPVTAGMGLTRVGARPPELGVGAGGAPSTEVSQRSCLWLTRHGLTSSPYRKAETFRTSSSPGAPGSEHVLSQLDPG